jgi:undecaprenyl-diphosphatase
VLRSKFHPLRDFTLAAAAAVAFAVIALSLPMGGPSPLDTAGRAAIHARSTPGLTAAMRLITQLGGGWFLYPLGAFITAALYFAGRRKEALLFALAVLGANLLDETMKLVFHRARPASWFEYPQPSTYSFPSGHSFVSFCFYFSLAEILIRDEWSAARRYATWAGAALLTLSIGFSRAYLGVHYPTDVLAGFIAAIVWTTAIRIAHHSLWPPPSRSGRSALPAQSRAFPR